MAVPLSMVKQHKPLEIPLRRLLQPREPNRQFLKPAGMCNHLIKRKNSSLIKFNTFAVIFQHIRRSRGVYRVNYRRAEHHIMRQAKGEGFASAIN